MEVQFNFCNSEPFWMLWNGYPTEFKGGSGIEITEKGIIFDHIRIGGPDGGGCTIDPNRNRHKFYSTKEKCINSLIDKTPEAPRYTYKSKRNLGDKCFALDTYRETIVEVTVIGIRIGTCKNQSEKHVTYTCRGTINCDVNIAGDKWFTTKKAVLKSLL